MSNVPQCPQARTAAQRQAAIDRATARAWEQYRAGNQPTLLRTVNALDGLSTTQVYVIGSRVTAGQVYQVVVTADADGISSHCECEAQHAGRICWHRAAARMAALGEIGHHEPGETPAAIVADPSDPADWLNFAAD